MSSKIIFLRTCTRPIPRVLRFMEISRRMGLEPEFWGAYRDKELGRDEVYEGEKVTRKGDFFPLVNGSQGKKYVKGVYNYCSAAVRDLKKIKRDVKVIHCSDVEPFMATVVFRLFSRAKVIYNIHDNLSQRYCQFPAWVNFILNQIEGMCVVLSTVAVVPEEFRRAALPWWCRYNVKVAKNSPMSAIHVPGRKFDENSTLMILYAGWLDEGRCIEQLIALAEAKPWIEIIIAGDGDPSIHQLVDEKVKVLPNLIYKGYVANSEAIELTQQCDLVFANYKANRVINIFAASNKIAEALCTGRPVIINQEIKISKIIQQYDCGVVEAFGDIDGIINKLQRYRSEKGLYEQESKNARQLYDEQYSWEQVQQSIEVVINSCLRG
jgi:glycosyltransferase involved in cell wall biosynthesis